MNTKPFRLTLVCGAPGCPNQANMRDFDGEPAATDPATQGVVIDTGWLRMPDGWRFADDAEGVLHAYCPTHDGKPT